MRRVLKTKQKNTLFLRATQICTYVSTTAETLLQNCMKTAVRVADSYCVMWFNHTGKSWSFQSGTSSDVSVAVWKRKTEHALCCSFVASGVIVLHEVHVFCFYSSPKNASKRERSLEFILLTNDANIFLKMCSILFPVSFSIHFPCILPCRFARDDIRQTILFQFMLPKSAHRGRWTNTLVSQ